MIPVKICGITNLEDARLAYESGAAAVGFIFYDQSPRYIRPEEVATITTSLPESAVTVGVFVNHSKKDIEYITRIAGTDMVQLHGNESPEFCSVIERPVIKAFRIGESIDLDHILKFDVTAVLLDSYQKNRLGGTGRIFDWALLAHTRIHQKLILAGGLNPDNVLEAIQLVKPAAVDVSSGVELTPGKKDPEKMKLLFNALMDTESTENIFSKWTYNE